MSPKNKLLLDHLLKESQSLLDQSYDKDWRIQPVTLAEFVRDHLRLEPLTDRQLSDLLVFLGNDPKKVFSQGSPYNLFCWLAGKGSGKDYVGSIVTCYLFYLLLCLHNPQEFFGFPVGEALDILIISFSADQALYISFDKIKQRMKNWMWLKTEFSILWGDKYITPRGKPEIHVMNEMIRTHNNIRIIAEHSANESYEGYNILFFIMSESSAFKSATKERNGQKVFQTLKTSASSRFPSRWKGMVMSFPRYTEDVDFTVQMHDGAKKDPTIWASTGAPWDYKPARFFTPATFEYTSKRTGKTVQVPVDYKAEFESDPDECERKYLCWAGVAGRRVMTEDVIIKAIHDKPPLFTAQEVFAEKKASLLIEFPRDLSVFRQDYLITVDLGRVNSAAALALQHRDPNTGYVLDALIAWTPQPEKGITVDLLDVKGWLKKMAQIIPNLRIGFDQWQSLLFSAELKNDGIKTIEYHTYERDYDLFHKGMSAGMAHILDDAALVKQLQALIEVDGEIVLDKRESTRKDLVDVVVGGFKTLMDPSSRAPLMQGGYYIGYNLDQFGGTMIENNIMGRR